MKKISDKWPMDNESFTDIPTEPNELAIPFAISGYFMTYDYIDKLNATLTEEKKEKIIGELS